MIDAHFDSLEKLIIDNPIVILCNINRFYTSPGTGYIKGEINFIDNSTLNIFQHVRIENVAIKITDYRYHYMEANKKMVFRYDNAPHHPNLISFPHHKHILEDVVESKMTSIEELIYEINMTIIKKF